MSWRCSSCWQPWCFTTSSFFKHMHPCWTSTASSSTKQKSRKGDSLLNTLVICIMGLFQVYPFLGHSSSSTPDSVNHLFRILLCAQGHCQAEKKISLLKLLEVYSYPDVIVYSFVFSEFHWGLKGPLIIGCSRETLMCAFIFKYYSVWIVYTRPINYFLCAPMPLYYKENMSIDAH